MTISVNRQNTGRKWCYISDDYKTNEACKDDIGYDRRYNMSKSYAACSSPDPYSTECFLTYDY